MNLVYHKAPLHIQVSKLNIYRIQADKVCRGNGTVVAMIKQLVLADLNEEAAITDQAIVATL